MSSSLLSARQLTHLYTAGKGADNITISVEPGEVVGFIGPNGAGKTTTISMLTGLLTPQSGVVRIFDKSLHTKADFAEIYSDLGYLPSDSSYYKGITTQEMINYAIKLRDGDWELLQKRARNLARRLDLDVKKRIAQLSLGNKRKVGILLSIFFNPKLIIMDEPTTGLDPLIQRETLEILKEMSDEGAGILLSSHNLAEVDQICDRIVIIKDAKTIFSDKISNAKKLAQKRIRFELIEKNTHPQSKAILSEVRKLALGDIKLNDTYIELLSNKASQIMELLLAENITEFTVENPSLEEMFINYYKKPRK